MKTPLSSRLGTRFAGRMMITLAVTLTLVGVGQYALVADTFTDRALQQLTTAHEADANVLRSLYGSTAALPDDIELLDHIASRPGVEQVALLSADGSVVAVGRSGHVATEAGAEAHPGMGAEGGPHGDMPAGMHGTAVAPTTGRTVGQRLDGDSAETIRTVAGDETAHSWVDGAEAVVVVPVELAGRAYVLEVVRSGDDMREQVADLRRVLLTTLTLGLLLALPVFYAVGGRGLRARHEEALQTSTTDALTGLRNHRSFHEGLRTQLDAARRHGRPLTLLLVDLDGFKQVNDTHGHRRGDTVLAGVGVVLRDARSGDLAYRIGGDEFALLLPDTDTCSAGVVAERVRSAVEAAGLGVTTSIGLAGLGVAAPDAESLVRSADAALYDAKRRGRNQVVVAAGLPAPAESAAEDRPVPQAV
jgi:diguanylate cyclase (GGDEF)-like protein